MQSRSPLSSLLVLAMLGALSPACGSSATPGDASPGGPASDSANGGLADGSAGNGGASAGDAGPESAVDLGNGAGGADARLASIPDADPACEVGLTASSTLVMPGCRAGLASGPAVPIPDGTYALVAITRDFRCLPNLYPPPASGTLRVTGNALAGVDGALGPNGVAFTPWKGELVYNGTSMVQVNVTCGSTARFGDEILVEPGRVTFFRPMGSAVEAWAYQRQ
jgi:hypothetical protein